MRRMRFAISIPQFYSDGEFDPAAFRAYFARAEELGFDSVWAQEQVLGPAPQLGPIETMTYAAACTERLRLGCAVFVSTLHSPVHLAKSLSTLDQLSRGRIEIGVGTGGKARQFARLRRGSRPVRRAVHRGTRADEGAVDRFPRHLRRGVLAAPGRGDGAQAVPETLPADLVRRGLADRAATCRTAGRPASSARGPPPPRLSLDQVQIVRDALTESGRPAQDFPIAKRVYIAVDEDAGRARERINTALERLYGRRSTGIEAAAIAGTPADCVRELHKVAEAGAELILFTPMFDQAEHAERLAAEVIPRLG